MKRDEIEHKARALAADRRVRHGAEHLAIIVICLFLLLVVGPHLADFLN